MHNNATCDVVEVSAGVSCAQAFQASGLAECPESLAAICPTTCGKCDCCSNDIRKCDVDDVGNNITCALAWNGALAQGHRICPDTLAEKCPKTCEICRESTEIPSTIVFSKRENN